MEGNRTWVQELLSSYFFSCNLSIRLLLLTLEWCAKDSVVYIFGFKSHKIFYITCGICIHSFHESHHNINLETNKIRCFIIGLLWIKIISHHEFFTILPFKSEPFKIKSSSTLPSMLLIRDHYYNLYEKIILKWRLPYVNHSYHKLNRSMHI